MRIGKTNQGCFAVTSLSSFIDSGSLGYTLVSSIYCIDFLIKISITEIESKAEF